MLNPSILIWEGCDSTVAEAIKQLQVRWRPSSTGSSEHTIRLMKELIEPAIADYAAILPERYRAYLPGIETEDSFTGIIKKFDLNLMARLLHKLLIAFVSTQDGKKIEDDRFVETLETLIGLVDASIRKVPAKTKVKNTPLNNTRRHGFCRFCGFLAEFTAFAGENTEIELYPPTEAPEDKQKTLRLSSLYCLDHRPKLTNGEWNPEYRKAKRSEPSFDLELRRLSRQSATLNVPCAESGDPLIDGYIYHYVCKHGFQPADEAELRHHAYLMADAKLSDRKKKMLLLQRYAFSQSEIGRKLGIPRQCVSRDLASIPDMFRQLPTLRGFPAYFASSKAV